MTINITDRSPGSDRDRREQLGISADDLAGRAGITIGELTAYEHAKSEGDSNPTIAMKVADALDEFERDMEATKEDPEAHLT